VASRVAYIYWSVRPELIQLGPFALRWYSLFFALLFGIGFLIVRYQFRVEKKNEADLDSLLVYLVVGTIVGARLGHCLLYEPDYYLRHPLEILEVWKGGLASHGGAVGVLLALYLYQRHHRDQPYLWLLDRIAVPTALAGSLIRLGNLFNSEILGLPTQVPWAFVFTRVDLIPRHPAQLYESLSYALVFLVLLRLYLRWKAATPRGVLLGLFLVSVFSFRFGLEFLKERQADYETKLPLSVGQWLSIPFIVCGLVLLWYAWRRGSRPDRPAL
jgi:phosphatidylglycerol:prolipoprotein diacylglycerol transferase